MVSIQDTKNNFTEKVEDKIGEERQDRVKQTKNVFKIPKDQFKIRLADNRKGDNEDISSMIHLDDDQKFIDQLRPH